MNRTSSESRLSLIDLRRRYNVRRVDRPRKCPECGTKNTIVTPKNVCLMCEIEKGKKK